MVLLRSSWQTVNIGDIAHTPGVLALLEKHPIKHARNEAMKEHDHAPLRQAIKSIVEQC